LNIRVFTWDRIPCRGNEDVANVFNAALDWTVSFARAKSNEILSPNQSQTKVTKNILHCLEHGCLMGWLIDPDEKAVIVYPSEGRSQVFDEPEQVLPAPALVSELKLTVEDLVGYS